MNVKIIYGVAISSHKVAFRKRFSAVNTLKQSASSILEYGRVGNFRIRFGKRDFLNIGLTVKKLVFVFHFFPKRSAVFSFPKSRTPSPQKHIVGIGRMKGKIRKH